MADSTFILANPWFVEYILPFLLVFTLIFAILEKSKMLGEGKKQVDALVSLSIALMVIAFSFAREFIVNMMPYFVIMLIILFVFMFLFGFITAKKEGDMLNRGLKITLGIVFGLAVLAVSLYVSGLWTWIYSALQSEGYLENAFINVIILGFIGGAIAIVLGSGRKGEQK
jgi:hypothetical protein